MKTVRFSKVVEERGKPMVNLLMTETDPDFQKALHADKMMSLSDDSHDCRFRLRNRRPLPGVRTDFFDQLPIDE
jgi:hypothetical protein